MGKYVVTIERVSEDEWRAEIHVVEGAATRSIGEFSGPWEFVRTAITLAPVYLVLELGDERAAAQLIGRVSSSAAGSGSG